MSEVLAVLRGQADAQKAAEMAAYHKTSRPVLGVSNPQIDAAVREWRGAHAERDWIAEANALWSCGVFEARIAAAKLLTKARYRDGEAKVWDTIVAWVPDFDGWAIADHAAKAGERRVMTDLNRLDHLEGWTESKDFWTRRAALIFTLPLAKLNHPSTEQMAARARVLGWAAGYVPDREWFIQKAIGWWLRTLSVHDPATVRTFLAEHGAELKAFARKEASRKLPEN